MNPIQDFHDALKQFREIQHELLPDRQMYGPRTYGNIKNFNNLAQFHKYYDHRPIYENGRSYYASAYVKKTDMEYKKRNITQYITVTNKEDPSEYHRQYQWFKANPGKTIYKPKDRRNCVKDPLTYKMITSKISVSRKENPSKWKRQYNWFRTNPDAEVYEPYKELNITHKINVSRKENQKEWARQYHWFRRHPEADVYAPVTNQHGILKH